MLNPKMLKELKDIIFNESKLPKTVKEPIHNVCLNLATLEYAYEDFLNRNTVGIDSRADVVRLLIEQHGGSTESFDKWFQSYEQPVDRSARGSSWGS